MFLSFDLTPVRQFLRVHVSQCPSTFIWRFCYITRLQIASRWYNSQKLAAHCSLPLSSGLWSNFPSSSRSLKVENLRNLTVLNFGTMGWTLNNTEFNHFLGGAISGIYGCFNRFQPCPKNGTGLSTRDGQKKREFRWIWCGTPDASTKGGTASRGPGRKDWKGHEKVS